MNVAFLGLGSIGLPMARRIAGAGLPLTVWNRTASKAADFARESGARLAETPAEAARGADIVITCFPSSRELLEVMAGEQGLMAGLARGAVLLDCTSGDPANSRMIAERVEVHGVSFMDAPVSGGVAGAVKGELTVMCGGEAETLERVRPVLETFGKKIVHCGDVGTGDALKAMNNALLAIHVWSTGEALATLTKAGVDPAIALDVINASSGRSNTSMNLFPERVLTRAFPRTFRLALLEKDIGIAAGIARELRVPSPITQLAAELFTMARAELGEVADHVEAVRIVEQWAGTEIIAGPARGDSA
ncbi:MAG: 6-phosphogluconate dehydrogenase NAD-binding protein [Gemmatimonadetes bacterium]|nr:6-phosphogluconate dehydrogenase NAD-binding protein [Gemmatimonadota bacterium]